MYKLLRRGSGRMFIICIVLLSLLLCLYYVSQIQTPASNSNLNGLKDELKKKMTSALPDNIDVSESQLSSAACLIIEPRKSDIDAQEEFKKFDFQVKRSDIV